MSWVTVQLRRLASSRAFTLVEILVVILVLAILVAVAVPSFLGHLDKAHASEAKQQLSVAYKAAQAATVREADQGSYVASGFVHADLAQAIKDSEPQFTTGVRDQGTNENPLEVYVDGSGSDATTADRLVLHNQSKSEKYRYCTLDTVGAGGQLNVYCNSTGVPAPALTGSEDPYVEDADPLNGLTVQEGVPLYAQEGSWYDTDSYSYQWQSSHSPWVDIAGATAAVYTPQPADVGGKLRVCVTAHGLGGDATACSPAVPVTGTVQSLAPVASGTGPQISGLPRQGETLTVSQGTWSSAHTLSFSYQWLSCVSETNMQTCSPVGTDQSTYVAQVSDIGNYLRATVTVSDQWGASTSQTSAATPAVSSSVSVGTLVAYAGSGTPSGWHLADGSALSRSTYGDLFAVVGTTYGSGDGSTTFNLPNLAGRIPLGVGSGVTRGQTGGALDQSGSLQPWGTVSLSFSWTETPSTPASVSHSHTSNNPLTANYWINTMITWLNPSVTLASANETYSVGSASLTASGSVAPTASYSVSNPPFRVVRYLISVSPTATAPCGALWGYGGAAPAGTQMADGSAATGSLAVCLDGSFSGNVPSLEGRFPLGKAQSGTGSTLGGAGGTLEQTVSATLNTASTQGSATSSAATASLTVGSHSHTLSYSSFSQWTNGGSRALAVPSSPAVGQNSNAGQSYNSSSYSPGTLVTSGSSSQAPVSAPFSASFRALNWVAYTQASYSPAAGTVTPYAGASAPSGWLLADGACYSTSAYAALFAAIGYTHGGSGSSFCVPDLRGRMPLGKAQSGTGSTLGGAGGSLNPSPSLSFNGWTPSIDVPSHSYSWTVPAHTHSIGAWGSNFAQDCSCGNGQIPGRSPAASTSTAAGGGTVSGTVGATTRNGTPVAGTTASPTVAPPPYVGLNFIVFAG